MPPVVNYTKEEIVNAALKVVREEGGGALTARGIARAMGGSTQPIYRVFGTTKALEQEALRVIRQMAFGAMLAGEAEHGNFLTIGLEFLRFARREPALFKYAFIESARPMDLSLNEKPFVGVLEKMRRDEILQGMDDGTLKNLFRDMWIYTQGLASFGLVNTEDWDEELYFELLHTMGGRLIALELLKKNKGIDYSDIFMEAFNENHHS